MDAYTIVWSDMMMLRRRFAKYLLTTLLSPLLYLMAFGWGLGRGMSVNGSDYLEFVVPGIIALTAMTTSFNGAGTRLNTAVGLYAFKYRASARREKMPNQTAANQWSPLAIDHPHASVPEETTILISAHR